MRPVRPSAPSVLGAAHMSKSAETTSSWTAIVLECDRTSLQWLKWNLRWGVPASSLAVLLDIVCQLDSLGLSAAKCGLSLRLSSSDMLLTSR